MPNKRILELPSATTPLAGDEQVPIVQQGATRRVPVSAFGGGGGAAQVLVVNLPVLGGTFSGSEVNGWDVAEVVTVSTDAHWDDDLNAIVFDVEGVFEIEVRGNVTAQSGSWPGNDIIVYGARVGGADIGAHGRTDTATAAGFTKEYVRWTDKHIHLAAASDSVVVGLFADGYTAAGESANYSATVIVRKIA